MRFENRRTVDPEQSLVGVLEFNGADFTILKLDKDEFTKLFGPTWHQRSVSNQLDILADLAAELEGQAKILNLTAAPPVLKTKE